MSFLVNSIDVCLKCFLTSSAKSVCLFCQCLFRRNLLMSAWTELACLLASIFLVSSIGVCLKCFPLLVCQCLSSGPLGFLLKRDNRSLSQLLPSVSEQSYSKGTEVFLPICITCLFGWFTLFLMELVSNFLQSLEDANWMSSLGSSKILFQNLSDLLLVFSYTIFYQDCTSPATCK